jgi:hypothetical protein
MYSVKCDLCGKVETGETPFDVDATMFTMNTVTRHACKECAQMLKGVFAGGREAMKDPLIALSKMGEEKAALIRRLELMGAMKNGDFMLPASEFSRAPIPTGNVLEDRNRPRGLPGTVTHKLTHKSKPDKKRR